MRRNQPTSQMLLSAVDAIFNVVKGSGRLGRVARRFRRRGDLRLGGAGGFVVAWYARAEGKGSERRSGNWRHERSSHGRSQARIAAGDRAPPSPYRRRR